MSTLNKQVLSSEIDVGKVRTTQKKINVNSDLIEGVVSRLVSDYCSQLDDYMTFVQRLVTDPVNPPTDKELDDFALNIPVLLYFTGEAQEALGVKEDVAKAIRQEVYNEAYDKAVGTIADKTAAAELIAQNEAITHIAYQRAYRKVKLRMEAANELLQSVKKVMTRRMTEYEISRVDSGRIGGR